MAFYLEIKSGGSCTIESTHVFAMCVCVCVWLWVYVSKQIVYTISNTLGNTTTTHVSRCIAQINIKWKRTRTKRRREREIPRNTKTFYGYKNAFIDTVYNLIHHTWIAIGVRNHGEKRREMRERTRERNREGEGEKTSLQNI